MLDGEDERGNAAPVGRAFRVPKLGKLVTLKAVDVWRNEPQVFTPWLADNLDLLAEALQIDELELKSTEVAAGDFKMDILALDTEGHPVIIENQFGPTDHRHLGQLISYAASQKGEVTVVWVAERFKDDHRAAIDWLNGATAQGFDFFAVEIEALQIGNSDPAPYFNVVAKPNTWAKTVGAASRQSGNGELAARHKARMAYWESFAEYLKEHDRSFRIGRPNRDHWFEFSIGRAGIVISATISTSRFKRIGVELYLSNDPTKAGIKQLMAEKTAIEAEFGEALEWQELPNKKASRIAIFLQNVDPSDPSAYPQLHAWMLDHMQRFRRVFAQRVKRIDFDGGAEGDEDPDRT